MKTLFLDTARATHTPGLLPRARFPHVHATGSDANRPMQPASVPVRVTLMNDTRPGDQTRESSAHCSSYPSNLVVE
jgi:hypothetical protein